jgi:hypothetical protein
MSATIHTPAPPARDHIVRVLHWPDALIERSGYPVDHPYVEMFWLPVLGPTATWLARRLVGGLHTAPEGYDCDVAEMARALGVSYSPGRNNPFARALQRCAMFGVSQQIAIEPVHTIAVRTVLPRIPQRHLARLPETMRTAHDDWVGAH